MTIKPIDANHTKIEFPILKRKLDIPKYSLKKCEYLVTKQKLKEIQNHYQLITTKYGLLPTEFMLLWIMIIDLSINSNKGMNYGIGDRETCARHLNSLCENEYCVKYKFGNSTTNIFVISDKGIDVFLNIFEDIERNNVIKETEKSI